jgi:hypothetical protein
VATWAAAWPVATVFVAQLVLLALAADVDDLTTGESAAAVTAGWIVFLVALALASRTAGTGALRADYGLAFRPVDLLGIPAGFALQLFALPLLYWPLRELWPDTFNSEEVEERATELVDRADGGWIWVLAAIVVVGAPIVEELVYRGLLQRSLGARIHFTPVEIPGLFLAGLAFGVGVAWTGRIGPGLITHLAFNATGLAVVLWW